MHARAARQGLAVGGGLMPKEQWLEQQNDARTSQLLVACAFGAAAVARRTLALWLG